LEPFSAPLVLPGDDLSEDPEYPPQSIHEWQADEDRNEVKPRKNTIYVAAPPAIDSGISFVKSWSEPKHADSISIEAPKIEDVAEYLKAFYHGMPVKLLPPPALRLTQWGDGKLSKTPRYLGLNTATECVRIRTRASQDGVFARQLNLDDLLDAAISLLPDDAFALLLLVPFDIYESPDDDFACGRAYGGSRVAVISTARYACVCPYISPGFNFD
jgi:archaemetzincin